MLRRLEIKNYAIIENLELELQNGLSIITGETGAGKSILLGAIGLIMGNRADSKVLYEKDQKAVVEATFDISKYDLKPWFHKQEMDYDDEVIIRRVISPNGKSRAFLNDEPTNLSALKSLTEELVDMHQQFDMLDIHNVSFQTNIVDALAGNIDEMKTYRNTFQNYKKLKKSLSDLVSKQRSANNEAEFLNFQMSEFNEIELVEGEQETKELQLKRLNNSEDIQRIGSLIGHILVESESNILDSIRSLSNELDSIKGGDSSLEDLSQRLNYLMEEISDISRQASDVAENTEYDGALIQELTERLDSIYKLQQKHNVNSLSELLEVQQSLSAKLNEYGDLTSEIAELESEVEKSKSKLLKQAKAISNRRNSIIPKIQNDIKMMLTSLSMEHAELNLKLEQKSELTPSGTDEVVFYFKANKGGEFNLLKNVASGGEISRLTLCLKSMVAHATVLPTLIFDEIDTGVSGDVAGKMGGILANLSSGHQIISITHSPQIAAQADSHYFVYKEEKPERTVTGIKLLNKDDRIEELAKMLSGNPPSQAAIANAKELLKK